ncbi:MAG TPA: hypothetical protein VGF07_11240 [Stellaceae bacterium]|jgi:hypothetical protein
MSAAANRFELTLYNKSGGPLTKRIALGDDGSVKSDGSACVMSSGTARRFAFGNLAEFGRALERMTPTEALSLGRLRADLPDEVPVIPKRKVADQPGAVARTQDFIAYEPGAPALALVDFDKKGMPPEMADRIDAAGGLWAVLVSVVPQLADAGRVLRRSTSAGLVRTDTGEPLPGSGGMHIFVAVRDGGDVERFLKDLHARCWLAGYGWLMVGAGGQLLERSIVDRVVGTPERLVFEGAPVLVAPLAQDPAGRKPSVVDGDLLDSKSACPPLTLRDAALLKEMRWRQSAALSAEAGEARKSFIGRRAQHLVDRGVAPRDAAQIVGRQCDGILHPAIVLPFDDPDLAGTTVADVLADPDRFVGETLADPLEGVEYGPCKAKVMRRDADGSLWINSFAHGRTVYELKIDAAAARREIEAADRTAVPQTFARCMLAADLSPEEIEELRNLASERSGITRRTLMAMVKSAQAQRAEQREAEAETARILNRTDPRLRIEAPAPDAPWLPQMELLEETLSADPGDEPPTRDVEGGVTMVRERSIAGLHELTAHGSNGTDKKEYRLPPPSQLVLARLDRAALGELIERHIDYHEPGNWARSVHLSAAFVDHYLVRQDSALPTIRGATSMPLVMPDGSLISGPGLDRRLGIVFRVPYALRQLLPTPEQCQPSACARAMRFLTHEWLCDVSTDYAGRCVIVAAALTIIERCILPERPAFFIAAGQRGGGKTTTVNLISTATLGHRAAAAAWSPSDEERRKALFSYLAAGIPLLAWDNIPRGAAITDPTIEKVLTSETLTDRTLGVSDFKTVPTTTVQIFTGNNVGPRGDMASRSLNVRLNVDRPDPENRDFAHPEPIEWTLANRGKILRALFVILLGNPRRRQECRSPAVTRFKSWWDLVGSAVEHAAAQHAEHVHHLVLDGDAPAATPIDFRERFAETEEADEQTLSVAAVLTTLKTMYGTTSFTSAQVARFASDMSDGALAFRSALEHGAGKAIKVVSATIIAFRLKAILGTPANVGGRVLALQYHPDHHGGFFRLRDADAAAAA